MARRLQCAAGVRAVIAFVVLVASGTVSASPVEALVRAHLGDVELRTCLTTSSKGEHVFRVETRRAYLDAEALDGGLSLTNCMNRLLAQWSTGRTVPSEPVTFVLAIEPGRTAIAFDLVRESPRAAAAAVPIELVAGAPGGRGAHDGAARDARFALPLGVAADGGGHLFVAEAEHRAIRRVDLDDGRVTTAAVIPQSETVMIDGEPRTLERQNLNEPSSLAFDAHGTLYALDTHQDQIWQLGRGGLEPVWENPSGTFDTPQAIHGARAMVFDRDGTLLVADSENQRIVRIDLATKALTPVAGAFKTAGYRDGKNALFDSPEGLALDDAGHLFVAESANHTIREITLATGETRTLAGRKGDRGHADGVGDAARFDAPASLAWDRGELYVAESSGLVIRRIDVASRRVATIAGTYAKPGARDGVGAAARFRDQSSSALGWLPPGLAIAGGILYLSDSGNHTIRAIDPATGRVTTLAGAAAPEVNPRAIALAAGQLYATAGEALYRLDASGPHVIAGDAVAMGHDDGTGRAARFRGPKQLGALPDGSLIVGEVNGEIRRVEPKTGRVKTIVDVNELLYALAVDRSGAIYAATYGKIERVGLDGKHETVVTGVSEVAAMATDGDIIYVLDNHRSWSSFFGTTMTLRVFDLHAHTSERLATWVMPKTALGWPRSDLVFDGKTLWIAHANGGITAFDPHTRSERVVVAPAPDARGLVLGEHPEVNSPTRPIIDSEGNVLVIDEGAVLRVRVQSSSVR